MRISIRTKLSISFILVVFVPLILISTVLTLFLSETEKKNAIKSAQAVTDKISYDLSVELKIADSVLNGISVDKDLFEVISQKHSSSSQVIRYYFDITHEINSDIALYLSTIQNVRVFGDNDTLLDSTHIIRLSDEIRRLPWYQTILAHKVQKVWQFTENTVTHRPVFSVCSYLDFSSSQNNVVVVDINTQDLSAKLSHSGYISFLVHNNVIVSASQYNYLFQNLDAVPLEIFYESGVNGDNVYDGLFRGIKSKMVVKDINARGINGAFKVITVHPEESFFSSVKEVYQASFRIILISFVLSLFFIVLFSNLLTRKIKKLKTNVHIVTGGNLDYPLQVPGWDEITELSIDLSVMVKRIQSLLIAISETKLEQEKIKLKMLSNQMNPHFLFNALETIRMQAICDRSEDAAEVCQKLGVLLRRSLDVGNEPVPLLTEIELAQYYLEIQRYRFGEKVHYEIHMETGLQNYKVLPFILQPILENSMVHGLENKEGNGRLIVEINSAGQDLIMTVKDNGIGMTKEKCEEINRSMQREEAKGIGIMNVAKRIKLFYGEAYGLTMESEPDQGTTTIIRIPMRE